MSYHSLHISDKITFDTNLFRYNNSQLIHPILDISGFKNVLANRLRQFLKFIDDDIIEYRSINEKDIAVLNDFHIKMICGYYGLSCTGTKITLRNQLRRF